MSSGSGLLLEPHSDDSPFRPLAARAERGRRLERVYPVRGDRSRTISISLFY